MKVAVVIPAYNEAATVARVAETALKAPSVDRVIVVDDGSTDGTDRAAAGVAGVEVIRHEENRGKGEAMRTGVEAANDCDIIVFLDADLTGLRPDHIERLIEPVRSGRAVMACGLFDRGPRLNWLFLRFLPVLTGERALRREIFEALEEDELHGYKVEAALNSLCKMNRLPVECFVLDGMFHVVKEKKRGLILGLVAKVVMLATAIWSYVYFHMKRAPRYVFYRFLNVLGLKPRYRDIRPDLSRTEEAAAHRETTGQKV